MAISSKEVIIIISGVIGASIIEIIVYLFWDQIKNSLPLIIFLILILAGIGYILYKKINEVNKELERIDIEQQKLKDNINIYKRLAKIEAKLKI